MFNFSNKDSEARCWTENLPALRGGESTRLTFLLYQCQRKRKLYYKVSNKTPETQCPYLLFPVPLSVHPSGSLLPYMFILLIVLCQFPVTHCLFHLLSYGWLYLILSKIFNQKAFGLKVCSRAKPHHNWKQAFPVIKNSVTFSFYA